MRPLVRSAFPLLTLLAACSKGESTAPTTGTLQVNITGLGTAPALVNIGGPAAYTRSITGTSTLSNLAPGVYAINAAKVPANGATYAPSPAASSWNVVAGTTPTVVDVAYGVSTGAIALTVSGLPSGTNGI